MCHFMGHCCYVGKYALLPAIALYTRDCEVTCHGNECMRNVYAYNTYVMVRTCICCECMTGARGTCSI